MFFTRMNPNSLAGTPSRTTETFVQAPGGSGSLKVISLDLACAFIGDPTSSTFPQSMVAFNPLTVAASVLPNSSVTFVPFA